MRFHKARNYMKSKGLDYLVLMNTGSHNPNFFYLSGLNVLGLLLIGLKEKPLLVVPPSEYHIAMRSTENMAGKPGFSIYSAGTLSFQDYLKQKLGLDLSRSRVGLDYSSLTVSQFKALKKKFRIRKEADVAGFFLDLRMLKDVEEIASIGKACVIAEKILLKSAEKLRNFVYETDYSAFLSFEAARRGCKTSFSPIVASGPNTGKWHHSPERKKIGKGFLIVDFGVRYRGYCSDITRTFYVGRPSEKEKKLYNLVMDVQSECISMALPGRMVSEIQEHAEKRLGKWFVHGLGHGLGLEIHEKPLFSRQSGDVLEESMVLTIEPGIYHPGKRGVRIEDDIVVGKGSPLILTDRLSRSLKAFSR